MKLSDKVERALGVVEINLSILYGADYFTNAEWVKLDSLLHKGKYVLSDGLPGKILEETKEGQKDVVEMSLEYSFYKMSNSILPRKYVTDDSNNTWADEVANIQSPIPSNSPRDSLAKILGGQFINVHGRQPESLDDLNNSEHNGENLRSYEVGPVMQSMRDQQGDMTRQIGIEFEEIRGVRAPAPYTSRFQTKTCMYWARGRCYFTAENCHYLHAFPPNWTANQIQGTWSTLTDSLPSITPANVGIIGDRKQNPRQNPQTSATTAHWKLPYPF